MASTAEGSPDRWALIMLNALIRENTQLKMMVFAQVINAINTDIQIAMQQHMLDEAMKTIELLQRALKEALLVYDDVHR